MRNHKVDKPGLDMGVVDLGGLGHLVVKFAKAFSLKVTTIGTTPSKRGDAINVLGADGFLLSHDDEQMKVSHTPYVSK